MTKLIFPSDGISKYFQGDIDECSANLLKAVNEISFDIPDGFTYKSYLNGLENMINDYRKEVNSISYKLQTVNNNFNILADDLETKAKRMEALKIIERDRMII